MMRKVLPFVRYTLNTPLPLAAIPRFTKRDCTEKREELGIKRTANGSSNDSSMSLKEREALRLKGGLFQSKSILRKSFVHAMYAQCIYALCVDVSMERQFATCKKL